MIYWLALLLGGVAVAIAFWPTAKNSNRKYYLEEDIKVYHVESIDEAQQAVDLATLSDRKVHVKLFQTVERVQRQIGDFAVFKLLALVVALAALASMLNTHLVRGSYVAVAAIVEIAGLTMGYFWLQKREKKQFEEAFPDALNMLASAVSAGESIMHAIVYVGRSLEGDVGKEFKRMGERLQMGESADSVFRKSCDRFPYPAFHFFVITLRANMQRGGQLKEVISRLNRLMFDNRAIEKKKYAMTSEARTSAKIVAVIPFIFLFSMKFLSPQNYEFIMFNPSGKPLLYYLIVSETIGLTIVWMLMRGAQK